MYLSQTVSFCYSVKPNFKQKMSIRFKQKLSTNMSLIMVCLQNDRECLSLATFCWNNSNLKEVSYLPWQNKYLGLKTNSHSRPKFVLWTKLLENLVLVKNLLNSSWTLRDHSCSTYAKFSKNVTLLKPWYTHVFVYQVVRKVNFSDNFVYVRNEWSLLKSENWNLPCFLPPFYFWSTDLQTKNTQT